LGRKLAAAQRGTVRRDPVADHLAFELSRQVELDAARGTATPSQCASFARLQPCTSNEVTTTTKATLKYSHAFGNPASNGIDARKMPTAPRSPVHEMNASSAAR
jgi:hypothetical protein